MINFHYGKHTYTIPENLNEFSADQLLKFVQITASKMKVTDAYLALLQVLLNKNDLTFEFVHPDARARMIPYIIHFFDQNTLTDQLMPEYRGFHGPKKEFDNLKVGEFHFTETYYRQMVEGDQSAVSKLIATMYRKPVEGYNRELDSKGDIRIPFNANEIEYYAAIMDKWPSDVKQAIVMWYDGCRQNMERLYDKAFSGSGGNHNDNELGMYDVIRNLSGDRFGLIKDVEEIYIHTAFMEIEKIMEENKPAK